MGRPAAAELAVIAWADRIPRPCDPLPAQMEAWLEDLAVIRNRAPLTIVAYRHAIAQFAAFLGPDPPLDRTTIRRYQIELADVLPNPRTRARALVALRSYLRFLYDEGSVDHDLARAVTLPQFVMTDVHPIRTDDVPKLLAALPTRTLRDLRDRALIHFLLSTGCRIAEACALNRDDVRREGFRVLGKGGKYRTVYVTDAAFAAVDDYRMARGDDPSPALWIAVANRCQLGGVALAGNRLSHDGVRRAFAALRERMSGDPETFRVFSALRSPHVLRHTAATTLLEATGGDVRLVQEVLGHATLATLQIYCEITDARKLAGYRRLGDYLAAAV